MASEVRQCLSIRSQCNNAQQQQQQQKLQQFVFVNHQVFYSLYTK